MSDRSTSNERESERQCPNLQAGREYAEHVWDSTLMKRKLEIYPLIAAQIFHQVRQEEISGSMSVVDAEECRDWLRSQVQEMEGLQKKLKDFRWKCITPAGKYQSQQKDKDGYNMIMERPEYEIDVTLPKAILDIQRKHDVNREAAHLNSDKYAYNQVETYRSVPGRCYYESSRHTEKAFTQLQEVAELKALKINELSKEPWIPENVSKITRRTREGHALEKPLAYTDWGFLIWDEGGEDVKELIPAPKRDGDVVEQAIVDLEEQYWSFCQSVRLSSLTGLQMDSQGPSQGGIHESSNTPTGSTNHPTRYHPTGFKHGGPTPKGLSLHPTDKEWRQAYCAANTQREEHHKRLEHTRNSANKDRKNGKTGQIAIQLLKNIGKLDASYVDDRAFTTAATPNSANEQQSEVGEDGEAQSEVEEGEGDFQG